jgi:hypothetical protein
MNPGIPTPAPAKSVAAPETTAAVVMGQRSGSDGQSRNGSSAATIDAAKSTALT